MMSRLTNFDELYDTLGSVLLSSTGVPWWRKAGMKAAPSGIYSLIHLMDAGGLENVVTEDVQLDQPTASGETFAQVPWGTSIITAKVEFFRSAQNKPALSSAVRFKNSLMLEERFWDLWLIAGLIGGINIVDVSAIFRQDTEPRAEVQFNMYANIAFPLPLEDTAIHEFESQPVEIDHVRIDGSETKIETEINKSEEE